jgi:hypothetical protein
VNSILSISRQISGDIITINNLLDSIIGTARNISTDTDPIEESLDSAHVSTCGIGVNLLGLGVASGGPDEHC